MKATVAALLVAALVMGSAGALLTVLDAGEWMPAVVLAALAYVGTFWLYRRLRERYADRQQD
ncbi:hypothetical protein GCM10011374_06850 [Kocuria dechangensis]|uniref:Uncharacterized protein n=1 Tax=Kocuria dechangensis TaxID=1176249 RepID=A0A917GID7_9MICC|nr:hypothetical protein [Kocuria dechangensis]GGG47063.1 hypothetical protein GCM10011374_06850 [Kocuria dechangensis]